MKVSNKNPSMFKKSRIQTKILHFLKTKAKKDSNKDLMYPMVYATKEGPSPEDDSLVTSL